MKFVPTFVPHIGTLQGKRGNTLEQELHLLKNWEQKENDYHIGNLPFDTFVRELFCLL